MDFMDFLLGWIDIIFKLIAAPFYLVKIAGLTGFQAFLFIFASYSVYLFAIAFGIALFQMPFKGSDPYDYC